MIDCNRCNGTGEIVTCVDDLCANSDVCIHGDGYDICPVCRGDGVLHDNDDEDYQPGDLEIGVGEMMP